MDYKKIFTNREARLKLIMLLSFIPDKLYLKFVYKIKTGKKLNLRHPVGFNEKLNWLKLHNKDKKLTDYVDKISARDIVKEKIGEKYLIKTYGCWNSFDEIDFNNLPNSFVLKCNHDSGSVKIIKDKSGLTKPDFKGLRKFFKNRLKIKPFYLGREYPYKGVKPKIYAEEFIVDESGTQLKDYKFFCFNGTPKLFYIAKDRGQNTTFDFYSTDFHLLDVYNCHSNSLDPIMEKPKEFEEMLEISKKLSEDFPFVRIDLYLTPNGIFFGEYTFFHCGGFYLFKPEEWEKRLGDYIKIG